MISKCKFADFYTEHSQVNASWDVFEQQTSTAARTQTQSPQTGRETASPGSPLLPRTRNYNDELTAKSPSNVAATEDSSPSKRKRSSNLIEPETLDLLLLQLRSDEFAGTIDLEYHSQYFEPALSEVRLEASSSRNSSLSQLTIARNAYFREALRRPSKKLSRTHTTFGGLARTPSN